MQQPLKDNRMKCMIEMDTRKLVNALPLSVRTNHFLIASVQSDLRTSQSKSKTRLNSIDRFPLDTSRQTSRRNQNPRQLYPLEE